MLNKSITSGRVSWDCFIAQWCPASGKQTDPLGPAPLCTPTQAPCSCHLGGTFDLASSSYHPTYGVGRGSCQTWVTWDSGGLPPGIWGGFL